MEVLLITYAKKIVKIKPVAKPAAPVAIKETVEVEKKERGLHREGYNFGVKNAEGRSKVGQRKIP